MEPFLLVKCFQLLDSSSESSSEEEADDYENNGEEVELEILHKSFNKSRCHLIRGYVESIVPSYTLEEFRAHFRISRTSVNVS